LKDTTLVDFRGGAGQVDKSNKHGLFTDLTPRVTVVACVMTDERGRRFYVLRGKLPLIGSPAHRRCGEPAKGVASCASVLTFSADAPPLKIDGTTLLPELRRSMMLFGFER